MSAGPDTPSAQATEALVLEVDVMVETPAWRSAVRGVEALCRKAATMAVGLALPKTVLADAPVVTSPGLALCVVLEDDATVADLNKAYRGLNRPTNVLSFAALEGSDGTVMLSSAGDDAAEANGADDKEPVHLGDVIIAFETSRDEADQENRPLADHLAHLVVHGVLHLLGLDHQETPEAEAMEALETRILASLGVPDPYADPGDDGAPKTDAPGDA